MGHQSFAEEKANLYSQIFKPSPVFPYDPNNFPKQDVFRRQVHGNKEFPVLSLEDVRSNHGTDVWVVLEEGVFDVTTFLEAHPGGQPRIQMVNGQDLGEFWKIYKLHNRAHIRLLLEEMRIGVISKEDAAQLRVHH